ncbi:MAG TPA: DUF2282 domain-containing protein [Rhodanobacteraceae bacterium]
MNNQHVCRTALVCAVALGAAPLALAATTGTAATANASALAEPAPIKIGTPAMKTWHDEFTALIQSGRYVKCYGINAAYKNECGSATHACGWNAPKAHDPNAWVLVPTGLCQRIAGGSRNPAKT